LTSISFFVSILTGLTGFYAGFAIFNVLGYMYISKCVSSFAEVAAQGPELVFVVYPEGLSLMGTWSPLYSVLFFVMMLFLGFGSEVNYN
jgi:solute carrier family 6 (neurotransmitter transporter, glycine) member 5/9